MWLDRKVSLYKTHSDNTGKPATYRQVLFTEFARDINIIGALRKLDRGDPNYYKKKKKLRNKLQCFTPAALLASKATGKVKEISRNGIMQLDFDYKNIHMYDIEELKHSVFKLPFISFCSLSCSGYGFYALALIAEPDKLTEYAEHCFKIFSKYGIVVDESKGENATDLRYVSYDSNMLIRENPEILRIKHFIKKPQPKLNWSFKPNPNFDDNIIAKRTLNKMITKIAAAPIGTRFNTIRRAAYTLGGYGNISLLDHLINTIYTSSQYDSEKDEFIKVAKDGFKAGSLKPFNK